MAETAVAVAKLAVYWMCQLEVALQVVSERVPVRSVVALVSR